jgi:uncharacterized membrane protein
MLPPTSIRPCLHPIHAILLSFPVALFAAALVSDITYLNSAEVQWSNFSQWAITGALVLGAPVVIWAVVARLRSHVSGLRSRPSIYLALVSGMWLLGLINALKHSQDAWSSVGTAGVLLSILCTALAFAAAWIAHSTIAPGEKA